MVVVVAKEENRPIREPSLTITLGAIDDGYIGGSDSVQRPSIHENI